MDKNASDIVEEKRNKLQEIRDKIQELNEKKSELQAEIDALKGEVILEEGLLEGAEFIIPNRPERDKVTLRLKGGWFDGGIDEINELFDDIGYHQTMCTLPEVHLEFRKDDSEISIRGVTPDDVEDLKELYGIKIRSPHTLDNALERTKARTETLKEFKKQFKVDDDDRQLD